MFVRKAIVIALAAVAGHVQIAGAEPLPDALRRVLKDHALMQVVDNDVEAARGQISVERSAWFPRLTVRNSTGRQDVDRDVGTSGNFDPSEMTFGVSQLLWDFGATNAAIHRAQQNFNKETDEHEAQRQNLLLAGIEAHLKLLRAQEVLEYALQSEEKIKNQAHLEDIRVQTGAGYTTDVLQAKAQLAGAQARRVYAEGQLQTATNRYRAVFGAQEFVPQVLDRVHSPVSQLPKSVEDVLAALPEKNIDVRVANSRAALTKAERDALRAREYMPRIELVMEQSKKNEYDGIEGDREDKRAMVQATWSFDFGMRQLSSVRSADHAAMSERAKAQYVAMQAAEEANNAWADLQTAKQRSAFLHDQVELATRFVELARKERELGRRSLLDVLNGETNLINAQSDAAAAETDEVLAAFRVMRAVGTLDVGAVSTESRQAVFVRPTEVKAASNGAPAADRS